MPLRLQLLDDRVLSGRGYSVRVAGLTVSLSARPGSPSLECAGGAQAFVVEHASPDLALTVERAELDARPPGPLLFDSGGVWRAYRAAAGRPTPPALVLRFHDPRLPFPYKEALLESDGRTGSIRLDPRAFAPDEPVDPLEHPLDELLFQRLLDGRPLGSGGGIELHAVGVIVGPGVGCVFAGQSGDGKTTTARLWQQATGASVLSDDRIVLTRDAPGRWRMHGTPWHGEAELALAQSAPVAAVFVLARGERSQIRPLTPAQAVAALLARSFPAFHDPHATTRLLERLEALVEDVPCQLLPFVPDGSAVRCVLDQQ